MDPNNPTGQEAPLAEPPQGEVGETPKADSFFAQAKPPVDDAPALSEPALGVPQRPDSVPEKFWNSEKGEVNTEALLTSYKKAEEVLTKRREEGGVPTTRMGYLKVKEDGNLFTPEGMIHLPDISADDPVVSAVTQAAHEHDVSETQMKGILEAYFGAQNEYFSQFTWDPEAVKRGVDADRDRAENIISGVNVYMEGMDLSDEQIGIVQQLMSNAEGIKLLASMVDRAGAAPIPLGAQTRTDESAKAMRDEWNELLNKPELLDTDPVKRKRFEELGRKLYG